MKTECSGLQLFLTCVQLNTLERQLYCFFVNIHFDTYKFTKNWDRSMLTNDYYNLIFKQHSVNIRDLRTITSEILSHSF